MRAPQIARRFAALETSPTRSLSALASAATATGTRVYRINMGQPDLPVPPEVAAAVRLPGDGIVPYTHPRGLPATVAAWCRYYASIGIDLEPDDIVVTAGGVEAIGFALWTVADPGDEVLIVDPTYSSFQSYARLGTITLVPVPTEAPEYRLPSPEAFEERITPRTKAIVIINPNNPTGTVYTRQELAGLMQVAARYGLFVIADETYREMVFDGRTHVSALDFPRMHDYAIVVDSASKRFSATGLRIGCLASRNREVTAAALRLAGTRICLPPIEQAAIVPLLEEAGPYTDWLRNIYAGRRDAAYDALCRIPGVTAAPPEGAFYTFVSLPVSDVVEFARWVVTEFRSNGETVVLAPGPGFYVAPDMGHSETRLAFVLPEAELRRAVEILGEALAAYPKEAARRAAPVGRVVSPW